MQPEQIVVTGSRIRRSGFDSPTPVTVINGQEIVDLGFVDIDELRRRNPELEVEIVTGGASAAYGVDAPAGEPEALPAQAPQPPPAPVPQFDFGRIQPDEEFWVISKSPRGPQAVTANDDSPGSGAMLATFASAAADRPQTEVPLPLKHTEVHATITGYVGSVEVTQQFENPFSEKIEAVYLFPLPEKSAVSEFVMIIGERRIRGVLREREEAEAIYRQARAQGYQASLLTQHRPNIFEQKVANIEPGKQIDVNIRYFHTLAYADGWYSFVFPTVVGPRYNPPGHTDPVLALPRTETTDPAQGTAVRYLRPNERAAHDLSIAVDLDAGVAIEELAATHAIREIRTGETTARVELASQTTMPNRDFVLRYRVAGERVKSNLLTHVDDADGQGYFTLMVYPPASADAVRRYPVELIFVVDCSGSMSGQPLQQARDAILEALDHLQPGDTFQVIRFSDQASQFGNVPVAATPENLTAARRYVRALQANGGTQMINGIRAALDFPQDPNRLRFVTFMTDGYIGNEADIIGAVHDRIGRARIFSFGVGDSVNRYLLERMASQGNGVAAFLGLDDSAAELMKLFFARISRPALADVQIDWGGMQVADVYPARIPDLFVGRPVVLTGRFRGTPGQIRINGRSGATPVQFAIDYEGNAAGFDALPKLWARRRIADLADQQTWRADPGNELSLAIRTTALTYGLMSSYTSFVAVDASARTAGEYGMTVQQAVPVPYGVRYDTTVTQ